MQTLRLDPRSDADLAAAADLLRNGRLVVVPTETVYGLAANALDADAVQRIFNAKGRPASNPVIVHVLSRDAACALSSDWTQNAERLAAAFWPGPLTIVVRRSSVIPDIVTAGGDTVALRCPSHPVMRKMIELSGVPLAAPSANLSTQVSSTRASDALRQLDGLVDAVLMGEDCPLGMESTVVDATTHPVTLLRPGALSATRIADVIRAMPRNAGPHSGTARSPGQMQRHYAPRAEVVLAAPQDAARAMEQARTEGKTAVRLQLGEASESAALDTRVMPTSPEDYARILFALLNDVDAAGTEVVVIDLPPNNPAWQAVVDRLMRAAAR
jgi:L-threonylcarbamoyladenylate synthase